MDSRLGKAWLIAGYAFLYLPIVTLIVFSFNDSKMVTLWGGFTFKWYGVIAHDTEIVNGFVLSMKIALMTATASVVLGMLAAFAIGHATGLPLDAMLAAAEDFQGVPHRLEFVREIRGVRWYNDSIATAPERTIAAIHSFDEPIVLLLGGRSVHRKDPPA